MKRYTILIFSLIILFLILLIPSIPLEIRKGLAVLTFAAVLWITEAIPLAVTSLSIPVLAVLLGILDAKSAFAPFAHPIIFLFFGGFALATALRKYDLDRFLAFKIVSASKGSLFGTAILLFAATAFVSMWISNTSTTVMMLPLALGIAAAVSADNRLKTFLFIGIAYSASVGGIGTLVGSPPNGITAADLGMDFIGWLKVGLPTVVVLFPLLFLILYLYFKPNLKRNVIIENFSLEMTKERVGVLLIFLTTVVLWLFGKQISAVLGIHKEFDAVVAVFAVILLFVFKIVNWREIEEGTDWGTLCLFGGGIALSKILEVTGTSKFIAKILTENIANFPHLLVILSVTLFMIFATELMSNTATAAIFIPILIAAAAQMHLPSYELALPAGIAASCAFMLPIATPPNAIVYGTGEIKQKDMIKVGFILNIVFAVVVSILALVLIR